MRFPRVRSLSMLAGVVVIALGAAGCSSSSSTSAGTPAGSSAGAASTAPPTTAAAPPCSRPHAAGQFAQSFTFQGQKRTYQLYVPHVYAGTKAVPVVFDFHGYGSDAVQQMAYGNFKPEADRDDFIVVAPDGQDPADRHFNLSGEKGLQNDVQMVGALLDHIEATFCVDTRRVYSTGMSDGGAMTSVLACQMSNRFAAFAPVAVVVSCGGTRAVPIMVFKGTADPVVPYNGGRVTCCGNPQSPAAPATVAAWATQDKCATADKDVRLSSEVERRTWSGCAPGGTVVFYIIDGGGHTWPGSIPIASLGMTTKQIDATATIWKFFQAHTLPSTPA